MELGAIGWLLKGGGRSSRIRTLFLVLAMLELTEAMLAPLDFLALQSIKKNLQDMPGSKFLSSWDFSKDPCGFSGVLCSSGASQRVVALNLGDPGAGSPGLRGKLDGAIGLLSSLIDFTLMPGQVVGPIPETLGQLRELQFLGISKNFLTGNIPVSLGALKKLETVDLSYNQLSGSIPAGLGQLPRLSNLILCYNKLTGTIPSLNLTPLVRLDLKQNALSGSIPSLPPSLKYLALSKNQLSGGIHNTGGLQQLAYVDLSFNKLSGNVPGSLFGFHISTLQLQRNFFSGSIELQGVVSITIHTIDLSYNTLSGHIPPLLASAQNLFLNNNHFTGAVPQVFADRLLSAGIQMLYVQHNYLSQFNIKSTATLPLSSSLCIQYNCMDPPSQSRCPSNAGRQKRRPLFQCKP